MSARLMDPGIAAAFASGRVVIVPSAQRAAALRWNWARLQLDQGRTVWGTPEVVTWDAWLDAQWEKGRASGRVAAGARRLNRSQQLELWKQVLDSLEGRFGAIDGLTQHAAALMESGSLASQWLMQLSRLAVTDEERLLAAALTEAREWCRRHDCVALALCTPEQLAQFVSGPPPLVAGQRQLTALQQALGERCWPGASLLHECAPVAGGHVRLVVAPSPEDEIRACARWCEAQLGEDPLRRLLVISAGESASPQSQGVRLARELVTGTGAVPDEVFSNGLLAVEGGAPLDHQQLIADALGALRLLREPIEFEDATRVLGSPYLQWEGAGQVHALRGHLAQIGLAQWQSDDLDATLSRLGRQIPAATPFGAWLREPRGWPRRALRVEWARLFSQWLGAAGFARGAALDSRDAQRLQRWNELLDEFAALDAICGQVPVSGAVEELLRLAGQARHAARSGDAAITLTREHGAPLAHYDGIWVMGLAEQRWPQPPRPDPYVPLSEQRRCGWEAAGARQRLEQAQWALDQWRCCTTGLVLSHPRLEGDVHHRPSALPGLPEPHVWESAPDAAQVVEPFCAAPAEPTPGLAALPPAEGLPLRRGRDRLRLQQGCAFRGQTEIRLGATPAPDIGDGIHRAVRGVLLHGVLDGIWRELGDQRALNALDEPARVALFERHWSRGLARMLETRPAYPPRLIARERLRSLRLILRILAMEEDRPFFRVLDVERQIQFRTPVGVISLRVDRLDEDAQGRRWLIDYKSGKAEPFRLASGEAQPLQLALYEQALALAGESIHGMALLSLSPAHAGFTGAAPDPDWPGSWQHIPDWEQQRQSWQGELARLLREHASGDAGVAPLRDACRNCHLAGLCRRADFASEAAADGEAVGD